MSKSRNISHSLSLCAQRILPIILRGVFEWNGELFACPHITLEDKKKPFALSTWKQEFKQKRNSPVFHEPKLPLLLFFADPADPRTFKKLRMCVMDRNFGIDEKSKVYLGGSNAIMVKNGCKVDVIRFVRDLSDAERLKMFPLDDYGCTLRGMIYEASKLGSSGYARGSSLESLLERWDKLQQAA